MWNAHSSHVNFIAAFIRIVYKFGILIAIRNHLCVCFVDSICVGTSAFGNLVFKFNFIALKFYWVNIISCACLFVCLCLYLNSFIHFPSPSASVAVTLDVRSMRILFRKYIHICTNKNRTGILSVAATRHSHSHSHISAKRIQTIFETCTTLISRIRFMHTHLQTWYANSTCDTLFAMCKYIIFDYLFRRCLIGGQE